jgi:hypothetical protein
MAYRGPDHGLRNILKKNLAAFGFEITPIESGSTSAGIPDLYYRHREKQKRGFIECKLTTGWKVNLSPHQCGFLMREAMAGGKAYVAVYATGKGSGGDARSALWLLDGAAASRIVGPKGLAGLDADDVLGRWEGPPRSWDWHAIGAELVVPFRKKADYRPDALVMSVE